MRWQKNNFFVNFGLQGWLAAVCKCIVLWAGFILSLYRGRKNKINPLKFALSYQKAKSSIILILSLSYQVTGLFLHLPLTVIINRRFNAVYLMLWCVYSLILGAFNFCPP
jgi:hypothetical protein